MKEISAVTPGDLTEVAVGIGDGLPSGNVESEQVLTVALSERLFVLLFRVGYFFAMYTGLRAATNRMASWKRPHLKAHMIDHHELALGTGEFCVRVHSRAAPLSIPTMARAGMISLAVLSTAGPSISPRHRLMRRTSHFGCGDLEIAVYETADKLTIYGVRNIVAGNSLRIGWMIPDAVGVFRHQDVAVVIRDLVMYLGEGGLHVDFAPPDDCVNLSVDDRLLPHDRRDRVKSSLRRYYVKLWKQIAALGTLKCCKHPRSDSNRRSPA